VRPAPEGVAGQGLDFEYVIHNADGGEVEHCGNGARCFVRYVREKGLTAKDAVRVKVVGGVIELRQNPDGRVTVDMGAPVFDLPRIPFDPPAWTPVAGQLAGLAARAEEKQDLPAPTGPSCSYFGSGAVHGQPARGATGGRRGHRAGGRPGPAHRAPSGLSAAGERRLHAGRGPRHVRLRVFERGAGETLACGTGACAAVVAGIRLGLLDPRVDVRDARRPADHRLGRRQRRPPVS
jgi:diaminopimelate epimerase